MEMTEEYQEAQSDGQPKVIVPPKLADEALTTIKATGVDEGSGTLKEHGATDDLASTDDDGFGRHVHTYMREQISLADQKTAFVLAIDASLMGVLAARGVGAALLPLSESSLISWVGMLAIACLACSALLAMLIVFPRLKGSKDGIVFWLSVAEFGSGLEYQQRIRSLRNTVLTDELLVHVYELSVVCKRKYRLLSWSMVLGVAGSVLSVWYLACPSP
jgi:hypothetical protein